MFPLPMLSTIPEDLELMDPRIAFRYQLAFMKNTILRALNNIHNHACELQCGDPRLRAFFHYIVGLCDVLVLYVQVDERLFRTAVFSDVALEKLLGEGCVQDMRKVVRGVEKLRRLAKKYIRNPEDYDARKVIERLSFSREFSARSWAQIHSIDFKRIQPVCQEAEMRLGLQKIIGSFLGQSNLAYLIPFIHSHHDRKTSMHWPGNTHDIRIIVQCLAKVHSGSWELAPFDLFTGVQRSPWVSQTCFGTCTTDPDVGIDRFYRTCEPLYHVGQ